MTEQSSNQNPMRMPPMEPMAPELDINLLLEAVQYHCAKARISPVRYLELGSDTGPAAIPGAFRPSQLGKCLRLQVYGAAQATRLQVPWDARRQWWFDRGHVLGAWMLAYFLAAAEIPELEISDVQAERVVHSQAQRLAGRFDLRFSWRGIPYLVEVKSKDEWSITDKIVEAEPNHIRQLNAYMGMTGIRQGYVLYVGTPQTMTDSRGRSTFHAGVVPFFSRFDTSLWLAEQQEADFKSRCLEQDRLPHKTTQTRDCDTCEYERHCTAERRPSEARTTPLMDETQRQPPKAFHP